MNNNYSDLINIMRQQGKGGKGLQIATMTSANSCTIGDLALTAEDLYIPERLLSPVITSVDFDEQTVETSEALSAGDSVLIIQVSDIKFAILERI